MTEYLEKVFNLSQKLKNTNSRLDKKKILEEVKNDEDVFSFLNFLLSDFIVTGLSTKKLSKKIEVAPNIKINTLRELFGYLHVNNSGKDTDIANVNGYIYSQDTKYQDFLTELVSKKLTLGVTSKTINSIFHKNIDTFAVQLAEPYNKMSHKIDGLFYVTLKLDGNRCIAINKENGVEFYTRKGKRIDGLVELEEQFKGLPIGMIYDGEVILDNTEGLTSGELFTKTQRVVRKDGEKKGLSYHIFDILSYDEFMSGVSATPYINRRENILDAVICPMVKEKRNIFVLSVLAKTSDKSDVDKLLKQVLEAGYEGLMINTANGLYRTKRTSDLQKCKSEYDVDLLVVGIEKAINGQFKNQVARLNVEYKGNTVGVGSGLTKAMRKEWADNPENIIGKVIQVQYTEESQDEEGNLSLRFPRFKGVREDKTSEDVNYE